MRLGFVAPAVLSLFVAVACGGSDNPSLVQGGGLGNVNNGTGGTGLVIGGGSAASANGTGVDPSSACANSSADGQAVPVDLYFMVDTTGSMNCPVPDVGMCEGANGPPAGGGDTRWSLLSSALKAFVADPANADLGMGINFFPTKNNATTCNVNSYATPATEIGPLSTNAPAVTAQITMRTPSGETPTVPSLQAAINHASAWAKANPTHKVVIVYATDGYPQGCTNNTIPDAAKIAAAAYAATPSIATYVLGVGPNLTDLEQIAAAGSNMATKAFLVDTTQNAATQLSTALAAIRGKAVVDCTYTIPAPPAGQTLEPGKVNVAYTSSTGTVTTILQDAPGVTCDAGSGWQYSTDGKQINLCGSACTAVKADPGGKIEVLFGCSTVVGNPP